MQVLCKREHCNIPSESIESKSKCMHIPEYQFFFESIMHYRIIVRATRGTEPHVALRECLHDQCVMLGIQLGVAHGFRESS